MEVFNGDWIMMGTAPDDPRCLRSADEMLDRVEEIGFLPLFQNSVKGFSVEEMALPDHWFSGDALDPWQWRIDATASKRVAYGKFFGRRAGYISLRWLPYFANLRRDGYDFDALWDDGKASVKLKKIMDVFADGSSHFSFELKDMAGFGKGGEKNFEGTLTELEMRTYLVIRDLEQKRNRKGESYGWHISVLTTPESIWGYELLSSAYGESPEDSGRRIEQRVRELCPGAADGDIRALLKF